MAERLRRLLDQTPEEQAELTKLAAVGIVGLLLGLFIGWVVWPVEWSDASLNELSPAARAQYVSAVADAYVASGGQNPDLALARLRALDDPEEALIEALQYYQEADEPDRGIRQVNLRTLAVAIGADAEVLSAIQAQSSAPDQTEEVDVLDLDEPAIGWLNWILVALTAMVLLAGGVYIGVQIMRTRTRAAEETPGNEPEEDEDAYRLDDPHRRFAPPSPVRRQPSSQRNNTGDDREIPAAWWEIDEEDEDSAHVDGAVVEGRWRSAPEETPAQPPPPKPRQRAAPPIELEIDLDDESRRKHPSTATAEPDESAAPSTQSTRNVGIYPTTSPERAAPELKRDAEAQTPSQPSQPEDEGSDRDSIFHPPVPEQTANDVAPYPPAHDSPRQESFSTPADPSGDTETVWGEAEWEEAERQETGQDEAESEETNGGRLIGGFQEMVSNLLRKDGSRQGDALKTFVAHYRYGIPDYDESFTLVAEDDRNEIIGACGMGVNKELKQGATNVEQIRVLDVWFYDRSHLQSPNQLLVARGVDLDRVAQQVQSSGTVTGEPLVAEPGMTFRLRGKELLLDCQVEEVEYLDDGSDSPPFSSVKVSMTVRRKR